MAVFPSVVLRRSGDSEVPAAEKDLKRSRYQAKALSWVHEALKEGEGFLKAQPGYDQIAPSIEAVQALKTTSPLHALSKSRVNLAGKVERDIVAALTDVKPFWEYRTKNARMARIAGILNKLSENWWMQRLIDMRHTEAVHYACAGGCSYLHLTYDPDVDDLAVRAEDPRDVVPLRPKDMVDVQSCFGVVIRHSVTVNYARAMFPEAAPLIRADRNSTFTTPSGRAARLLKLNISPFWAAQGDNLKAHKKIPKIPTLDLLYVYVDDRSRSKSRAPVHMGDERTNWSYRVGHGERLYPRKRLIICTSELVLYDGPSPHWHGLYPLSKLTLDPLPWTWLGQAPMWDMLPLQETLNKHVRIVEDHNDQVAQPPISGNRRVVARASMKKAGTRKAGLQFLYNPAEGAGSRPPVDIHWVPALDPSVEKHIERTERWIKEIPGSQDLTQLAQMAKGGSLDAVDRITEALAPANRLRSRAMEAFVRGFAMQTASGFFQWYGTSRRLAVLGSEGLVEDDFAFDPGSLLPDFPFEEDYEAPGLVKREAVQRKPLPRADRAREVMRRISFFVSPGPKQFEDVILN